MAKSYVFNYTGGVQKLDIPADYNKLIIEAYGASGGGGNPGRGGKAYGEYPLGPADARTIDIYVGGTNSFNGGGGTSYGDVGGGATDVRLNGIGLANRIIVAGGGGGGRLGKGGDGGGVVGLDGNDYADGFSHETGGKGGTQNAGGIAGTGIYTGSAGLLGYGGYNGNGDGGGGGYYGGGSGACGYNGIFSGAGGGSSYIGLLNPITRLTTPGVNTGNGYLIVTLATDNKYLLKKGSNFYSLLPACYDESIHNFIPLTLEGGSIPNDNDINNFGFEELDLSTTSMTKGGDTLTPISKFLNTDFEVLYYKYKTT